MSPFSNYTRHKFKALAKALSVILVSIFFVTFISSHLQEFGIIFKISMSDFLILSILFFLLIATRALLLKDILDYFRIKLKIREYIALCLIRGCLDHLFFRGGAIASATHLKKYHNLYYSSSLAAMVLNNVIQLVGACVGLLASGTVVFFQSGIISSLVFWPVILFAFFVLSFLYLPEIAYQPIIKRFAWSRSVIQEWIELRKHYQLVLRLSIWFCGALLISSFSNYLIFIFIYKAAPFFSVVFLTSVGTLSMIIALTPAALGIREGIMGYAGSILGINLVSAVAVASLSRIINMFWFFLVGMPIFYFWYSKGMLRDSRVS